MRKSKLKKIVTILFALVLILTMSITAFAATIENSPGSQDIDVNAKYVDGVSVPTSYSVDVTWGAMEFTYTVSGTKTWDPETHTYTASTQPAWTASGNTITVTNHSNTDITASFAFSALTAYDTVTGSFSNTTTPACSTMCPPWICSPLDRIFPPGYNIFRAAAQRP